MFKSFSISSCLVLTYLCIPKNKFFFTLDFIVFEIINSIMKVVAVKCPPTVDHTALPLCLETQELRFYSLRVGSIVAVLS